MGEIVEELNSQVDRVDRVDKVDKVDEEKNPQFSKNKKMHGH